MFGDVMSQFAREFRDASREGRARLKTYAAGFGIPLVKGETGDMLAERIVAHVAALLGETE